MIRRSPPCASQPNYPSAPKFQRAGWAVNCAFNTDLVTGKARATTQLTAGLKPQGITRATALGNDADIYPAVLSATTDFTLSWYGYIGSAGDYRYALGAAGTQLALFTRHLSVSFSWGLYLAGGFIGAGEVLPVTATLVNLTITRKGSAINFFRDGRLVGTATNSGAVGAITAWGLNCYGGGTGQAGLNGGHHLYGMYETRAWTNPEVEELKTNPWAAFKAGSGILLTGGGAAAQLAGDATAGAAASGALTTGITLAGASLAAAGAGGDLSAQISLAGAAIALAEVNGQLTAQITLAGDALAQAVSTAGLDASILLAGDAAAQAQAPAMLTAQIHLTGAAAALAGASGALTARIVLTAEAIARAQATGVLTVSLLMRPVRLAGSVVRVAQFAGRAAHVTAINPRFARLTTIRAVVSHV